MMTASEMGKVGGKRSAESRFKGKNKKEISNMMKVVRKGGIQNNNSKE